MNILTRSGIFIVLLGLALGLPSLDSMLIDLTQFAEDSITLMQIGIVVLGLSVFIGGIKN